jgi:hypothetical protein
VKEVFSRIKLEVQSAVTSEDDDSGTHSLIRRQGTQEFVSKIYFHSKCMFTGKTLESGSFFDFCLVTKIYYEVLESVLILYPSLKRSVFTGEIKDCF